MTRPYEFIIYLRRLRAAYIRFGLYIWALNTAIAAILIFSAALLLGLPAFTEFYWRDSSILANMPAISSFLLGALIAKFIGRRDKSDIFRFLGPELSEMAKTGHDNRDEESLPMQSLAEDLLRSLSKLHPYKIFDWRQVRIRAVLVILLAGATIFIANSQISADITPNDFQSISDLKDRALALFKEETPSQRPLSFNFSGTSSIYGKPSIAVLNENKLELKLFPGVGTGIRARNTTPVEHLFLQSQPGEAAAVPSDLYIESMPPQNREIIKNYFENLAGS